MPKSPKQKASPGKAGKKPKSARAKPAALRKLAEPQKPKKRHQARADRDKLAAEQRAKLQSPDPFSKENLKKMGLRLGIPVVVAWIIAIAIPGWIAKAVVGGLTIILAVIVAWVFRYTRKAKAVTDIIRTADTAEARKEAIDKLDSDFKEGDTAATFAKAQLQLQEDPRAALETLESINLDKVMAPLADEARSQRAMIHLMLGEIDKARPLCDNIELSRHKEHKTRAMMASVIGEAWARTGQAAKAIELLDTFDPNDEAYVDLRPQLLRALAFSYAWANKHKQMKQVLNRLKSINAQLLMGFITKKKNPAGVSPRGVHPALEKEAFRLVMKSGAVPRKMQVRRY